MSEWETISSPDDGWETVPQESEKISPLYALPAGINALLPTLAGLPVDTARNLANLGISAYGMGRQAVGQALGETPSEAAEAAPTPFEPGIGSSKWMAEKMSQGLAAATGGPEINVFQNPRPESELARNLYLGGQVASGGLLAPAKSIPQVASNVARMLPSAAGAVTAANISDNPLAPAIGALTPMAIRSAIPQAKPVVKPEIIESSKKAGYVIPPTQAKPSLVNRALEGFAGKISTAQKASMKNVITTNEKVVKDLGLPKGTVLSRDLLEGIRAQEGAIYNQAKNIGQLPVDKAFRNQIASIAGKGSAVSAEFPKMMDKGITKLVGQFMGKKNISSQAAVELSKQLRADANNNFRSLNAADKNLARAQKQTADAIDGLVARNAPPQFARDFNAARRNIAKTYTAEKALNDATGNISARKLAAELQKGKPLSGGMKEAGQFAQAFPMAAQDIRSSMPGVSPLDYLAGGASTLATGSPGLLGIIAGRPLVRGAILSKPYQGTMMNQSLPIDPKARIMAEILATQGNK